jgi:hypothetical protein
MLFSAQEGISVPPAIPGLPTGQNAAESLGTAGSDIRRGSLLGFRDRPLTVRL